MRIANAVICHRAVFKHIETYHGLEIAFGRTGYCAHEVAGTLSLLYLFFCVTLKVLADSVDVSLVIRGRVNPGDIVINISAIDQKISRLGVLF
jgi:hypothetical protein